MGAVRNHVLDRCVFVVLRQCGTGIGIRDQALKLRELLFGDRKQFGFGLCGHNLWPLASNGVGGAGSGFAMVLPRCSPGKRRLDQPAWESAHCDRIRQFIAVSGRIQLCPTTTLPSGMSRTFSRPRTFRTAPIGSNAGVGSDLAGWTDALFARKISQLAGIVGQLNGGAGPDILGVCEVENRFVLDRLVEALQDALPDRQYQVLHADAELEKRGIDTAFVFDGARYSVDPALVFSHFVLRRTGTRDILQATFHTEAGNDLIVMCKPLAIALRRGREVGRLPRHGWRKRWATGTNASARRWTRALRSS